MLRQLDPSSGSDDPIYNAAGEWSYRRFERWLISTGVAAWPRLDSGRLDVDGDAFRLMYHVPGIEGLHALRDSLRVIQTAKLPIGRDGRNRPSLFPFGTATGRNAHCRSLYNSHAGMRGFMLFPPDKIGVYLDWRTQEVGVAGALSGDQALIDSYNSGDVYHVLALDSGLTKDADRKRWKGDNPMQRQRMKALQLGVNYGMGVASLAKGLNQHPLIASNQSSSTAESIGGSGTGATIRCKSPCSIVASRALSVGRCTSVIALTSAPYTIFRCKVAALKC